MILPYNRVVKDLNGYTQEEFLNKIKEKFDIAESDKQVSPDKKEHLVCILVEMVQAYST